jgi:hypothetical protein
VDAPRATRLAVRVAAVGYITSCREPGHRSVVTLELTTTGNHRASQAAACRDQEPARILGQLCPADGRRVTTTLRHLAEAPGEGQGEISPVLVTR